MNFKLALARLVRAVVRPLARSADWEGYLYRAGFDPERLRDGE